MTFLKEIVRRNVLRIGLAYLAVAWILVQIVNNVAAPLNLPSWTPTFMIVLLGVGFPIALIIAWAFELTPEGVKRTSDAGRNLPADGVVAQSPTTPIRTQATEPPRPNVLPNSVAVLPFENFSPKAEDAYFAAGIHEEILNSLAKLKSLNVIARTSVLQYAGTQQPIAEIARALGVETIMEGSVRYAGTRVRVTTQLIDASTGAHLWSEAYEREFDDIFAIQADIAVQVASALQAEFTKEEQSLVEAPPTTSIAAYALYLRVLSLNDGSAEGISRMGPLLDRALELDPQFSLALGFKAALYGGQLINSTGIVARDQKELDPLLRKYAAAALAIDPRDSGAHSALCVLAEFTWHWTEARPHALRALEMPSGLVTSVANWTLCWAGEADLAIEIARQIQRLNPTDWTSPWNLGLVLNYAGRYEEAAAALRSSIAILPALPLAHSWLAVTEIARGNAAGARRELELTEKLLGEQRPVIYLLDLSYAYARLGDTENARRLSDEVRILAGDQEIGVGGWAIVHMALGEHDEALKCLHTGVKKAARHEIDAGMFSLMNLKLNFTADPVLEKPEFIDARNRLRGD